MAVFSFCKFLNGLLLFSDWCWLSWKSTWVLAITVIDCYFVVLVLILYLLLLLAGLTVLSWSFHFIKHYFFFLFNNSSPWFWTLSQENLNWVSNDFESFPVASYQLVNVESWWCLCSLYAFWGQATTAIYSLYFTHVWVMVVSLCPLHLLITRNHCHIVSVLLLCRCGVMVVALWTVHILMKRDHYRIIFFLLMCEWWWCLYTMLMFW